MSKKELKRKILLEDVKHKRLTLLEAAERMEVGYRQAKRIYGRYVKEGDEGLVHKNRGYLSNHRFDEVFKQAVLSEYVSKYEGFGPTFAAEKLAESGYILHHDTLRKWLIAAGLWTKQRKRPKYRKRRERKQKFGELLQMDGSHHHWFGKQAPLSCLMSLVDDATGITMVLLAEQETTQAAMELLGKWISKYGIPKAIYVDLKTVYVSPNDEKNSVAFTHFSKACWKLGIKIIKAYSPQAKGRVERKHAVFQDRFVKELKLQQITDIQKANELLNNGFVDNLNKKFGQAAMDPVDGHAQAKSYGDLNQILCWESPRQVQNDWTISFKGKIYQLLKPLNAGIKPKEKIHVREHLDKKVSLWSLENKPLLFEILAEKDRPKTQIIKKEYSSFKRSQIAKANKDKTPWGKFQSPLSSIRK